MVQSRAHDSPSHPFLRVSSCLWACGTPIRGAPATHVWSLIRSRTRDSANFPSLRDRTKCFRLWRSSYRKSSVCHRLSKEIIQEILTIIGSLQFQLKVRIKENCLGTDQLSVSTSVVDAYILFEKNVNTLLDIASRAVCLAEISSLRRVTVTHVIFDFDGHFVGLRHAILKEETILGKYGRKDAAHFFPRMMRSSFFSSILFSPQNASIILLIPLRDIEQRKISAVGQIQHRKWIMNIIIWL
ncbi:hypothetical protein KIN20_009384 [Parelaphostrongylus tenuis]|uniref:Uncharacterized protein n=1 Tax=Parelaphostrongylus tenuis TaxID=148309 RepID=A0AAD5MXR1_PARTN|nr:hypothetical protein KIN20_009384 [Parelaphostrongylus tenuis]